MLTLNFKKTTYLVLSKQRLNKKLNPQFSGSQWRNWRT